MKEVVAYPVGTVLESRELACLGATSVSLAAEALGVVHALERGDARVENDLDRSILRVERVRLAYSTDPDPTAMWGPEDPDLLTRGGMG